MFLARIFIFCLAFVALVQCQRQTTTTEEPWIWGEQNPSIPTTRSPIMRTTPFRRDQPTPRICPGCPRTPQFNPVCASDMATYDNPTAVDCANTCGPKIEILFYAACQPTA
ncbi:uncharacterized protein LOC122500156 [Leptopilina heterotoma]|uniref:uncharacterized protein LOC122500156 n=1 Tax=Leptopilina heterotoma TaxID=63436 RepID=UPI001CA9607B|nr:uncharacterized protein LOC122500156 [Leptopilina heterotoma]